MMNKLLLTLALCILPMLGVAQLKAPEGFVAIEDQPSGDLRIYSRTGKCVKEHEEGDENTYHRWVTKDGVQDGSISIVYAPGNKVYIQRPVSESYYEGWVEGTLSADGHTITVANGQYTAYTRSFDMAVQVLMMKWDAENETFVIDEDVTDITFTVDDNGVISINGTDENHVLGCVNRAFGTTFSYLDNEWHGIGDYESVYTPFVEEPIAPPTDLVTHEMIATTGWFDGMEWEPYNVTVNVGFDGNDVWIQGLTHLLPKAWIKGTLVGSSVNFPSGQMLGTYFNWPLYLLGAQPDEEGNPVVADAVTFEYDGGTFVSYSDIMISSLRSSINYVAYYMGMTIAAEPDRLVTVPEGLVLTEYDLSYKEPDDQGRLEKKSYKVLGGVFGNEFYIQGISPYVPEGYVKGIIDDNGEVEFASPQYMGSFYEEEAGVTYPIYFQSFNGETGELKPSVTFVNNSGMYELSNTKTALSIGINKTGLLTQQYMYNVTLTPEASNVAHINTEQNAQWFSLDGRRIASPTSKGLYIKDGRVVVIP